MDDVLASEILNEMEEDDQKGLREYTLLFSSGVKHVSFEATRLGQKCVSVCLGNEREMFDVVVPTGFALLWRGFCVAGQE